MAPAERSPEDAANEPLIRLWTPQVKLLLAPVLALLAALILPSALPASSAPTHLTVATQLGHNEDIKVDVTRVPVPLELKYRGDATVMVSFVDASEVDAACGTSGPMARTIACVNDIGGNHIYLPNPCNQEFQGEDYASVICHEKGHILGWRHEMASWTARRKEW